MASLLISLDTEKAFDRVEWPFILSALNTSGLRDTFCNWVKLFHKPLAVWVNGQLSSYSPLVGDHVGVLFVPIVIEPLTEAVRSSPDITGIFCGEKE